MDNQAAKIEAAIPGAKVTRVGEGIDVTFDEKIQMVQKWVYSSITINIT